MKWTLYFIGIILWLQEYRLPNTTAIQLKQRKRGLHTKIAPGRQSEKLPQKEKKISCSKKRLKLFILQMKTSIAPLIWQH